MTASVPGTPPSSDRAARLLIAAVVALIVVAAVVAYAVVVTYRNDLTGFWAELAQVGLQSIVVGVLGVVLTAALNAAETRRAEAAREALQAELDARDEGRRRTTYRLELLRRVRAANNDIKRARRDLDAAGFRDVPARPFTPERTHAYGAAMARLGDANLDLEALLVELRAGVHRTAAMLEIETQLDAMELHLGKNVLPEYRRQWDRLQAIPNDLTTEDVPFARGLAWGKFTAHFSEPYRIIACVLVAAIHAPDPTPSDVERCTRSQDRPERFQSAEHPLT